MVGGAVMSSGGGGPLLILSNGERGPAGVSRVSIGGSVNSSDSVGELLISNVEGPLKS